MERAFHPGDRVLQWRVLRQRLIEGTPKDHAGRKYGLDEFAGEPGDPARGGARPGKPGWACGIKPVSE